MKTDIYIYKYKYEESHVLHLRLHLKSEVGLDGGPETQGQELLMRLTKYASQPIDFPYT